MNLTTRYLGLELRNPFIVGASPFCDDVLMAHRLEEAGASALVMRSLFQEQITSGGSPGENYPRDQNAYYAEYADYQSSPDHYLRQIEHLKLRVTIPIIASLNGHELGDWVAFAPRLAEAGADAIELNYYQVVTNPALPADHVETEMLAMMGAISGAVNIPVAAKISPFHTSVAQVAVALELAGAAGIVVFNRFYQPDVNTDELEVQPTLRLSEPSELLLRLRWLAILAPLLRGSLSAAGGVHTAAGAAKALLTGAHTVQVVSVLLKHGPQALSALQEGLESWMSGHGYTDVADFRGRLNHARCENPAAYERANYIRTLHSWHR